MGIPLPPDANGHYDGSNPAGVVGNWWSTGDDYGMDATAGAGDCQKAGFPATACSVLSAPTPGLPFQPDPTGRGMCTSGVAAQVINDASGAPAYSSIWGDIIGFDLNNPGSLSDGITLKSQYDAFAHGITGFAFDIDAIPKAATSASGSRPLERRTTSPTGRAQRRTCRRSSRPATMRSTGRRWAARSICRTRPPSHRISSSRSSFTS